MKCKSKLTIIPWMALLIVASLAVFGCTQQQRAKNLGGTAVVELPPGQKLVVATWKNDM